MSVIAMQVTKAEAHPNADALRVYTFAAPGMASTQVVANLEATYEVGDIVAVACVGALLKDGTRIKKAKLRGVHSFGMALGKTESPVGTDLSEEHCQPEEEAPAIAPAPVPVVKWTSIEQLHHVLAGLDEKRDGLGEQFAYPRLPFRAKIKLDGTNGAVHLLEDGSVIAQSRTRLLTLEEDNIAFAAWVKENEAYFQSLHTGAPHTIIYGEWCGKGIQKRTAISEIDTRIFAVFAVQYGDHNEDEATLDVLPARLQELLPAHPQIRVLPWQGEAIEMDFGDRAALRQSADAINALVEEVETNDPWVAQNFGVKGIGEGVVMYPILEALTHGPVPRKDCTSMMFKAKGEKHQVVKQNKAAQLTPEIAKDIEDFVERFVTEARLEQALQEACGGKAEAKAMGAFMKWIGQDVKKESPVELEASGLEWKQVGKAVSTRARTWYQEQCRQF